MFRTYRNQTPKFTKIVATVSGATCTRALLEQLYMHGMDVARLNTAHMKIEEMERIVADARSISPDLAVMVDTKGPNIRTCNLPDKGLSLKQGDIVKISGRPGNDGRIQVNYDSFTEEVPVGSRIICDDGANKFKVTGKDGDCLLAEVQFDSIVCNRKSVNVPDVSIKAPALTDKDRLFIAAAVRMKCDFIAHSFVRSAADIQEVRNALGEEGKDIGIIAKIENREGVDHIQEILQAADGIMVARGDLGIEIPLEEVPLIQKRLIHEARKFAKPVITATQMLQSMETSPLPTRAEVSDVANAVYDGTDAVMLSGETAHGQYPLEALSMMCSIVLEAERAPEDFFPHLKEIPDWNRETAYILASAVGAADVMPVKIIVCSTLNGLSARICSAMRRRVLILAPTPGENSMRKLALSYGVFAVTTEYTESPEVQNMQALDVLMSRYDNFNGDDLVVILGKHSPNVKRNNLLCISTIDEFKDLV